ncbi:MAG TPA: glycosyltransferase family 4 protein [Arthrobacter sp.]|nr:glycosyltransferase family 4 protein [Arthrobacter sp.]
MDIRFLVPANIHHNSGGNVYNAKLAGGLKGLDVNVEMQAVDGSWPDSTAQERRRLGSLLGGWEPQAVVTPGSVTIVDGLVACGVPDEIEYAAAAGQRVCVLLHMPSLSHADGEKRALRAAAGVICTSSWAADAVRERYGITSTRVALPGTDPAPVAAGSNPPHIIAVAALLPNKDQLLTVAALARLQDLAWTVSLVGADDADPGYAELVRTAVASQGMDQRVRLTGQLAGQALEHEWSRADLSLLVSRAETFGLVVTESLAHGIPVIVREGTGAVEALGLAAESNAQPGTKANALPGTALSGTALPGTAIELPAPDTSHPAMLATTIRRWLSEPGLRSSWRDAALAARERLPGWDSTARNVLEYFERIR